MVEKHCSCDHLAPHPNPHPGRRTPLRPHIGGSSCAVPNIHAAANTRRAPHQDAPNPGGKWKLHTASISGGISLLTDRSKPAPSPTQPTPIRYAIQPLAPSSTQSKNPHMSCSPPASRQSHWTALSNLSTTSISLNVKFCNVC